ncbi:helix-turn-helix transcriptional regulator [Paenibacillus sp. 2TAB23]|uniref:helix-turn-helix transcriptional regulator n=1 Tax=Paenibacillus sp. 2TAB23 TaxID=3233004 RepID=UPI003F9E0EE8
MSNHRMYHHRLSYEKLPVPGWKDIRNTTDVHSLYWVQSGEGDFFYGAEEVPLRVQAGDLLYMKRGFTLSMSSSMDKPLCIRMLLFDVLDIPYEQDHWLKPVPVDSLDVPFYKTYSPEQAYWVESQFARMWSIQGTDSHERQAEFQYVLTRLITFMKDNDTSQSPSMKAFQQAKLWMETGYHQPIRLEELAQDLGISVSQLRKMFMKHIGISPKAYLNQVRNEQAKTLLLLTDEPMKAIADACGFADEFHFGKMFRVWNGIAPARFRAWNKSER